jgi:hypothetical protein
MAFLIEPLSLTLFVFDIVESEGYQRAVEWTSFPVESGLGVSDHAIDTPAEVSFKGVVSDHPLSGVIEPQRATRAYEQLVAMMEAKRLVTVVSGLTVLSDMGIVSVNASRDADTGAAVEPEVTLRRIRIVQSVSVPVPPEILAPKAIGAASPVELSAVWVPRDVGIGQAVWVPIDPTLPPPAEIAATNFAPPGLSISDIGAAART